MGLKRSGETAVIGTLSKAAIDETLVMPILLLAATATAIATGLGAIPVFFLGDRAAAWQTALYGLAAGAMTVASIVGLLKPGLDEGSTGAVLAGVTTGVAFLAGARLVVGRSEVEVGGHTGPGARLSVLVFLVLFIHSFPEGFSIGTAYASDVSGLSLFVILAIGLQNVPEGTSVAVPMAEAGYSRRQMFWAAVTTSLPQPVGAAVAYLLVETVEDLLPFSFGFAAGAMLALVASDLAPRALGVGGRFTGVLGTLGGAGAMLGLSAALGV
jgi:ZIP family zinc transporter